LVLALSADCKSDHPVDVFELVQLVCLQLKFCLQVPDVLVGAIASVQVHCETALVHSDVAVVADTDVLRGLRLFQLVFQLSAVLSEGPHGN
jgi:hypothetical protein